MCLAYPVKILKLTEDKSSATVNFAGSEYNVDLTLIDSPEVGNYILIHAGMAIEKLDEEEAEKTLQLLNQLNDSRENH